VWIALPKDVRDHLVEVFCLTRTGVTEIIDQTVKSDGYSNDDLKRISLENMCQYIGSEETFMRAWELTLAKVHSELHPPVGMIGLGVEVPAGEGRTVEEAEKAAVDDGSKVIDDPKAGHEIKPWCDSCDSRGVRHKKECLKYTPTK
jgi:hypothetical protein